MSRPYIQTFHITMAYQPPFISWRNTSFSYPQTAQLLPPHIYIFHTTLDFILEHSTFNFMETNIH